MFQASPASAGRNATGSSPDTFGYCGPSQAGNPYYATAASLRLPRSPTDDHQPPRAPSVFASRSAYHRLLSTLAILEQREGALNHGSLSAFTAAKKLGGPIHGFVAGSNIKAVAAEAAKVDGVEKIIAVENAAYDKVRSSSSPLRPSGFRPPSGPRR